MIDENQETLEAAAAIVLAGAATRGLRIATAENYTGGLIAALLSSVDTRARWFERGVVAATEAAQRDLLGVPQALIDQCGPVSRPVALAMAEGARLRSAADAGLAVTGYPSPVGDGEEAGLVFVAACSGERAECRELHLGPLDSVALRDHAALAALSVLAGIVKDYPAAPRPGTIVEILPS
ncbi:CinA family protein [Sphingopyxis sp. MSC1_008]|jgi:nicotinamide-nucleotide amidase|uniref:CinA family protein n=1 Tax=Sphingopyxis sp. MSC1_008 TaxID=2909265 RepID=UPI0020C0925D|nr:nicotinamide-nucleotide amidohydrolase family protein [Sphingopyxis sp. MSC1_008]